MMNKMLLIVIILIVIVMLVITWALGGFNGWFSQIGYDIKKLPIQKIIAYPLTKS